MAEQETANAAALAIRNRSPDSACYPVCTLTLGGKYPESDEEFFVDAPEKKRLGQTQGALKLKEQVQIAQNGLIKATTEKQEKSRKEITNIINRDTADDLADIFISDEVLKQLRSQTVEKDKKPSKQSRRKLAKSLRKAGKPAILNNKEEQSGNAKPQSKKVIKSSLRRKSNAAVTNNQIKEDTDTVQLKVGIEENEGNKAENNNWMVDDETSTDMHKSVVMPSYYLNGKSSYMDTLIQTGDSQCRVCAFTNCNAQNCKGVTSRIDVHSSNEYSFNRADSSDDSGCFSNLSPHSRVVEKLEGICEGYISSGRSLDISGGSIDNVKLCSAITGLCNACGNEPQGNGSGLCKTCIGRIKYEGIRIGALGELRAYAQSIADSVKKILSISPRQSQEVLHQPSPCESGDERATAVENAKGNTIPTSQLQKCKTQISMNHSEDSRSKSLQNKSLSFDGRAAAHLDEGNKPSPTYWISQDIQMLPNSSIVSEVGDDKPSKALENGRDNSFIHGDYFSSTGKKTKPYTSPDNELTLKMDRNEKSKRNNYVKQLSCIERVKVDGDSRGNCSQAVVPQKKSVAGEHKKMNELQRGKSRISRPANSETGDYAKKSTKYEEDIKALNVFRLKVIHEGSPVDPLHTVQKGKSEDSKDRRAMLMRSATAPNKNHMPKKESAIEEKSNGVKYDGRTKRVNTKLEMSTAKPPEHKTEGNIEIVGENKLTIYDPQPDSWRDENSVMAVAPFTRRRSTSYDGSRPKSSRQSELHRSISRSAMDRDDQGKKQRRSAFSANKTSVQSSTEKENVYSVNTSHPQRISMHSTEESKTDNSLPFHSNLNRESVFDTYRYSRMEPTNKGFQKINARDHWSGTPIEEEHVELLESPSKSKYFDDVSYYSPQTVKQFSPNQTKMISLNKTGPAFGTGSYYCHVDDLSAKDQIVSKTGPTFDQDDVNDVFKECDDEEAYHNEIQKYDASGISSGKDNLWYSSHPEERTLFGRDLSHESKSSTSFHIVSTTRSSHSDVALMKHAGSWDHGTSRRQQSIYSETDVDTGLIYHFAKRQTTRAHVPAYHDLTSASRDIYTMSGDVSKSASSNSAISTKSEVSDNNYTGGFFKHDPFYDNDNRVSSSSSSADSSCHLYFEPSMDTQREPSELDIYTGALFSSSQNALSLCRITEGNITNKSSDALTDGSTNNSTRPHVGRMPRRLRYRPRIDIIKFKVDENEGEFWSKSAKPNSKILMTDMSNNSSSSYDGDVLDDSVYAGVVVKQTKDSSYTDYDAGMKPVFHVRKIEKTAPVLNFMKYERENSPSPSFVFTPTEEFGCSDDACYSGFYQHREESLLKEVPSDDQLVVKNPYAWQRNDDYYASAQRPRINKTNNSNCLQPDPITYNTNNNRFEDIYTGFFESPKAKTNVPEQLHSGRKTTSDNWYAEQPKHNYSSTDFYDEDQSMTDSSRKSPAGDYESTDGAYSSASVFGQASAAYSSSRTYMTQNGWREYDKHDMSSSNGYDDESSKVRQLLPEPVSANGKYNYFNYMSNQNSEEQNYMYDPDTYSFDERCPSPKLGCNEIRKVGGIVCRENVVNKRDYAEDVNRDLEQGVWMPLNFRREEKPRHLDESSNSRTEPTSDVHRPVTTTANDKQLKFEDSSYSQDHIYDNVGARNKWRQMSTKGLSDVVQKRETSIQRAHSAGDGKKQDYAKTGAWNPPDQIPDRARGKRTILSTPKPTVVEGAKGVSTTSNVISSVTSIPSRLTNYVKKWF